MKRRRIILVLALAAVVAGIVLCWPRGPKEPVYQGKRISQWIALFDVGSSDEDTEAAEKAMQAMGTNALPWLMSEFTRGDPKWIAGVKEWLEDKLGVNTGNDSELRRLSMVDRGFYLLGTDIAPAVPALALYLDDEERGLVAATAMGRAGDPAVPYLMNAIVSTNAQAAENAGFGIVRLAAVTESILPTIHQWLRHTNAAMRRLAIQSLARTTSRTNWIVPELTAALSDPDASARRSAAYALGRRKEAARPALPLLLPLMTNSDPRMVVAASNALFRIDPAALPPRGP